MKKFFITTAIDYPSSSPHLGHAYEKICADVIARFKRLKGFDVHFSTGTDEHGLKIQRSAERAGVPPQEFVDRVSSEFRRMCDELRISYNDFIRTTERRHFKTVRELIEKIDRNGDIYKGTYEGFYCAECETFYSEAELVDRKCPVHGTETEWVSEECFFFRMGKYKERIVEHIKKNPEFIEPESRKNEILKRLEAPLKDLCISRTDFEWGIPLPMDRRHLLYVWIDALINYITTAGYPDEQFSKRWPPDLHLIGKDISWHHCVIWTSLLFSLGLPLPKKIFVHGFITYRGEKLSKSKGVVLDPFYFIHTYSSDALRYFLIRETSFGQDGTFSEEALCSRLNEELVSTLGNFVHRVLTFTWNHFGGKAPAGEVDSKIETEVKSRIEEVERLLEGLKLGQALERAMSIAKLGNEYFQSTRPWEAVKTEPKRAADCILTCLNLVKTLSVILMPFLPSASEKIAEMLRLGVLDLESAKRFDLRPGHAISKPSILFKKARHPSPPLNPVSLEEFSKFDLRIGEVQKAERVPGSEKMLKLEVKLHHDLRTVMAGIGKSYSPEQLIGKKVVLLVNLKKKRVMGVESEGMILAAGDDEGELSLLTVDKPVKDGTKVR